MNIYRGPDPAKIGVMCSTFHGLDYPSESGLAIMYQSCISTGLKEWD